ncbi:MAG: DUF4272 domain-containing protein [Burkholderiales bacterium]|nr:DUF4272 domain-containing protein [Burkholderiales bacterium]
MKSPELRKELSELTLHKRGIRINLQLPLIESEDEIRLRDQQAIRQRLCALWAVCNGDQRPGIHLSAEEKRYLDKQMPAEEATLFRLQAVEALHFLAWCAGLIAQAGMPSGLPDADRVLTALTPFFEDASRLTSALRSRSKSEMLDWSDLLYRLHWAVRHAHLTDKPVPGRLDANAVLAWHKVANWMTVYDDEDDWDKISTETAG